MRKDDQNGFSYLVVMLIAIIIGLVGFTGWYVWSAKNTINKTYTNLAQTTSSTPKALSIKTFDECQSAAGSVIQQTAPQVCITLNNQKFTQSTTTTTNKVTPSTQSSISSIPTPTELIINFVDTSGWNELKSPDNSFQVSISSYYSYGFCKNDKSIVLLGMVYMDASKQYDCSSVDEAISMRTPYYLTRIGFGVTSIAPTIPTSASSHDYKLVDGNAVTRYSFQTTDSAKTFNNTEYVAKKDSKYYIAHYRVESDVEYKYEVAFDTVALKTWKLL